MTADLPAALRRRVRQVRADPALRLAARRDGRPDAGLRAHPRRDDGHRRRLHGRALQRPLPPRARRDDRRGDRRRVHGALRRDDRRSRRTTSRRSSRTRPSRSSATCSSAVRRRRLHRGHLPRHDARVLQGLPLPRLRLGDPRAGAASRTCARWAGSRTKIPTTLLDVPDRDARDRRHAALAGFFSKDEILAAVFHAEFAAAPWLPKLL